MTILFLKIEKRFFRKKIDILILQIEFRKLIYNNICSID